LKSTEADRRPVAQLSSETSHSHQLIRERIAGLYNPVIHEDNGAGSEARAKLGAEILTFAGRENECQGVEYGYRYTDSPIICYESGEPPRFDAGAYHASTWPGSRPPSLFLNDGSALYDHFGAGFTLLNFAGHDASGLEAAADTCGMPLKVVNVDDSHARGLYERDLVLLRPDHFVAWRGNRPAGDPAAIIDRVRGA